MPTSCVPRDGNPDRATTSADRPPCLSALTHRRQDHRPGVSERRPTPRFSTDAEALFCFRGRVGLNDCKYVSGPAGEQIAKFSLSPGDLLFTRYHDIPRSAASCPSTRQRCPVGSHATVTPAKPALPACSLAQSNVDPRSHARQRNVRRARTFEVFIDGWNDRCEPFVWTKTADEI